MRKQEALQGVLSVLPLVIVLVLVRAYPIATDVVKSFTNWDGLTKNDWVGFNNYLDILKSGEFFLLLRNNLVLLLHIPIQMFAGFILAILLYEEIAGWKFFRSVFFFPSIISAVIIGYVFNIVFDSEGIFNSFLKAVGLNFLAVEWLGNSITALIVINFCLVWHGVGWQVLILLGGLSGISPSVIESARIDGASYFQRLFRIIMPMMLRVVEYILIISVMWVFTGLFPFIFSMTGGGPGIETSTLDYMIYTKAFAFGISELGSACAMSIILLVIVLFLSKVQMMAADKVDDWGE